MGSETGSLPGNPVDLAGLGYSLTSLTFRLYPAYSMLELITSVVFCNIVMLCYAILGIPVFIDLRL